MKDSVYLLLTVILNKKLKTSHEVGANIKNALFLSSLEKPFGLRLIQTLSIFNEELKTNIWHY